ncbi:MAG: trigger factor [Methylovirgula sp.]|jgi:trigger factor
MQVTETLSQGLKREYKVVLAAADLSTKVDAQLDELQAKARIPGFRPGKVPVAHLKRLYGRSIMADVMQEAMNEANRKIIEDNKLRLAAAPKIDLLQQDEKELTEALEAKTDLAYKVEVEVLPKFDIGSFKDIKIERLVAEIPDSDVDAGLSKIADQNRTYAPKEGKIVKAAKGDKVTIDFLGKIGDEAFEGGAAEGVDLVLGSGSFIPGFEEQIEGMKLGDEKTISVTFPEQYAAPNLAGKAATFDVTLKSIAAPAELALDDAFATSLGFPDLAKMRETVRASLESEQAEISRRKWKRELLDALDLRYTFELPEALVSREFEAIWREAKAERTVEGKEEGAAEEAERADYQKIAQRRVRLGLLLAEIGDKAGVTISDDEVAQALYQRARNFPGMERQFVEFYRKNPDRLAEIRAPIFEEKVVDHLLGEVSVTDKKVAPAALVEAVKEFEAKSGDTPAA